MEKYIVIDRSERDITIHEDVTDYAYDPELGKDADVTILVKWNDQRQRDDGIRELGRTGVGTETSGALPPSPRRKLGYFGGFIIKAALEQDILLPDTVDMQPVVRPTGVGIKSDGQTAYACGNSVVFCTNGNLADTSMTVENPMFARLHSAAFSADGNRVLTAAASLDMLYEIRVTDGSIAWSMDLWSETPYNTNVLGQSFHRTTEQAPATHLLNPPVSALENDDTTRNVNCVIDDPAAYDWLGLTTALTPVFINAIDYQTDDNLLATSFSRGEAWKIDRDQREIHIAAKGLGRPHGFSVNTTGEYVVTDTRKEHVILLDQDFTREKVYNLSSLEGKKEGLEHHRWLQYTTELEPGLYCAVMSSRQTLELFSPVSHTRRTIKFHPDWGVQIAVPTRP